MGADNKNSTAQGLYALGYHANFFNPAGVFYFVPTTVVIMAAMNWAKSGRFQVALHNKTTNQQRYLCMFKQISLNNLARLLLNQNTSRECTVIKTGIL